MAIKNTTSVTSWVSNEIYDMMVEEKEKKNISVQRLAKTIIESHYKSQAITQTDAFKELQIEHIKNKFRLQKLYELIEKHTFESSEKYQKMVEDELQKMIQG
jgi:hypothetical protein